MKLMRFKKYISYLIALVVFLNAYTFAYAFPSGSLSASPSGCTSFPCTVTLSWSAQNGSNVYILRQNDNGVVQSSTSQLNGSVSNVTVSSSSQVFVLYVDDTDVSHASVPQVTPTPNPVQISNTSTSNGTTSVTVSWTTNILTDSSVDYGTSGNYGGNVLNSQFTTSHSLTIGNLTPSTTYHYKITSKDSSGNSNNSGDQTFTTAAPGSGSSSSSNSSSSPTATPTPTPRPLTSGVLGASTAVSVTPNESPTPTTNASPTPTLTQSTLGEKTEEKSGILSNIVKGLQTNLILKVVISVWLLTAVLLTFSIFGVEVPILTRVGELFGRLFRR